MLLAAGADLDQLDGRDGQRQAPAGGEAPLAARLEAMHDLRLAVLHHGELGGGAAHVEGEQVGRPRTARRTKAWRARRPPDRSPATAPAPASLRPDRHGPPLESIMNSGAGEAERAARS